jgi:hypothetical protein
MAGLAVSGCLALPFHNRSVKLSSVRTLSAPVSKIDLYYSGAVRAIDARDYARALDYLQTARAIAPEDVRVINAFGVVYDKLGRFDLSRRYYAQAKALDPTSRIVDNNLAYSERLQGLSREPLAFASAVDAEAKLQPPSGLMPGSPVVVVPIAAGAAPVVTVATLTPSETAPELFKTLRRPQLAAAGAAAVKPAGADVTRVAAADARPTPAKATAKLAGAPILLVDASGSPEAVLRISRRLTGLGWSVQTAPALRSKPVETSRIDYPARTPQIARALARTLRGPVPVSACAGGCSAIRLVVGKDARTWSQPKKVVSRS